MHQTKPASGAARWLFPAIILMLCIPDSSRAAEDDLADAIIEIQVTGSRMRGLERPNESSIAVADPGKSIESIISQTPSIRVNGNAGPGSLNDLYLRGSDPNQVLVLFNGVPVNDATNSRGGVADLGVIDPWYIDSMDVVTGAVSSVYGSQAGVGVIQLRSPMPRPGTRVGMGADSHNGLYTGFTQGIEQAALSIVHREHPRTVDGSSLEVDSGLAQLQSQPGDHQLRLVAWASSAEARGYPDDSGGGRYAVNRELEKREIDDASISFAYLGRVAGGELNLQASYRSKQESIDTPSVAPGIRDPQGLPALQSDNDLGLGYVSAFFATENRNLRYVLGLDYFDEDADSDSSVDLGFAVIPAGFSQSRHTTGVFFEIEASLNDALRLIASGRQDSNSLITKFSPALLLDWAVDDHGSIFLGWGEGFKLPSFYALFNPLVGNAALETETSETLEGGYRYRDDDWSVGLTLFDYRFKNLIDFDPGPPPRLVNRNRVDSRGMEIWWEAQVIDQVSSLFLSFTYTDTETGEGQELLGRPRRQYSARFSRVLTGFPIGGNPQWVTALDYRDALLGSSIPTGMVTLDSYHDLSTRLEWGSARATTLSVGLYNLLDEEYEETAGNLHKGISVRAAVSHYF